MDGAALLRRHGLCREVYGVRAGFMTRHPGGIRGTQFVAAREPPCSHSRQLLSCGRAGGGQVRADVPTVVRAYLLGDNEVLKEHCAPEMMERLTAIIAAQQAQAPKTHPHPTLRLNP